VLSDPDTKNRCIAGGATAYVVKPVERKSLVATVKSQIESRRKPKSSGN
jgi:response regulator RpfG family c-di-GMP phosphodiesterase